MFFNRTSDPIHVFAVSIWHRSNYLVIARSRVTKKHVRNDGNYFTDAELMHRLVPPQVRRSANAQHKLRQRKGRNRLFFAGAEVHASITGPWRTALYTPLSIDARAEPRHVWP